ncbi:Mu-like prophage major head subunit gpT family protein [Paracoccus sp. (in: a-proteobacteria)]|uniref:Mu-like prophage major head subunit gpT family protein n=1 Tax=Paracoccus sp. TaxID=267 RepID=UPI0026DEB0FC|nr:Mu-like prophage major head subunit gpT family protein [Paracoccus sp. (in: a-proteobacteria)]MDO5648858.1 Mu-like prophage major head subunit gpT family protein [Paracoccus sp. (in: a-proteobacteria)]
MDLNHANLAALNTAFTTAFNTALNDTPTTWGRIAMRVPSTTRHQAYPKLSDIKGMREWVGERFVQRLTRDGFTITNRKFENTIAVSVDDIEDDQVGIYTPLVTDFGQTAAELPDELVWEQLAQGFDVAHYDGQAFFDADHPVLDEHGVERSVSNMTDGAGPAWFLIDDSRAIKPMIFQDRQAAQITAKTNLTDENVFNHDEFVWGAKRRCAAGFGAWQLIHGSKADLTPENYAKARQSMLEMRGAYDRKINLRPKLLVVPPSLEGAARKILLAERTTAGATNIWQNTADLHVETRLI